MPRIEPVPFDSLPDVARRTIEAGLATGVYSTPVPLQVMAYSSVALQALDGAYAPTFGRGLLDPRLVELLRLRSATSQSCEQCSISRKDESVSEADVACLIEPLPAGLNAQESAAIRFFDRFADSHDSIDDSTFAELAREFTTAEIVELGYMCAMFLGTHRLMHVLAMTSDADPVLRYRPDAVDETSR